VLNSKWNRRASMPTTIKLIVLALKLTIQNPLYNTYF